MAGDPRVLEPVDGVARLEDVAVRTGGDLVALHEDHRRFAGSLRVEMGGDEVAVSADVLAVVDRGERALRAEVRQPHPARRVLPEVDDPHAVRRSRGSIAVPATR